MAISPNSQLLVQTLEAMPLLNGRYENISWVNIGSAAARRGCFSLVFKAFDRIDSKWVALKFFDIDPTLLLDKYRREAFRREHGILQILLGQQRCLQLMSGLNTFDLNVAAGGGVTVTIPCEYFAVEWLDHEIDDYFERQDSFDALLKLRLFNSIVLAVEALHRHEVFHRDVKPDNLRAYDQALKQAVVAIDLGTSAMYSSPELGSSYNRPVGAPAYSAPEAFCHLAGHRGLAPYTDKYALGCLLFELFNQDLFAKAVRDRNSNYDVFLAAMVTAISGVTTIDAKVNEWKKAIRRFAPGLAPVAIDGPGSSAPPGIVSLLNSIVTALTHVDFQQRPNSLEWVRQYLWSAIRSLENETLYRKRLERARKKRAERDERIRIREEALRQRLLRKENP
jgi:serine/threonine protein kinase